VRITEVMYVYDSVLSLCRRVTTVCSCFRMHLWPSISSTRLLVWLTWQSKWQTLPAPLIGLLLLRWQQTRNFILTYVLHINT